MRFKNVYSRRNGSHPKGKGGREGHGHDQDKAAAEEGKKQRRLEGSTRNCLIAQRLGTGIWGQGLLGVDGARSCQGLAGPWWLRGRGDTAQAPLGSGNPGEGTEGLGRERQLLAMGEAKKHLQAGTRWRKPSGKQRSILELDTRLISTVRKDWAIFLCAYS